MRPPIKPLNVKSGDIVRLFDHWGNRDAKVDKVGRKWFTLSGRNLKYSLEDGSNSGQYSVSFVMTLDDYVEGEKQASLLKLLRDRDVMIPKWKYPSEVLRSILDVLEALDDDDDSSLLHQLRLRDLPRGS